LAQFLKADSSLEEKIMKRIHMNHLHDLIRRLRAGESERRIARNMQISRPTIHKYHELARQQGYLEKEAVVSNDETLQEVLGPGPQPPKIASSLEGYGDVVKTLHKQGVEMVAIWQRLKDNYGYPGSYSSVRRFVAHLEPEEVEAYTRYIARRGKRCRLTLAP